VLCSLSPYFNSMFTSNMSESLLDTVTLPFLDCKTFETVLDFFYTGEEGLVTTENAEEVIQAASFMQIECLQYLCEETLDNIVTDENCIRLWKMAKHHGYGHLERTAWIYLLVSFTTFATTECFMALDVDELVSVLKHTLLRAPSEEMVCDAAMEWLETDFDKRKQFTTKVLGSLKLPLTSPDYLMHFNTRYPFLELDEEGKEILAKARNCHQRGKHTRSSGMGDDLIVIGIEKKLKKEVATVRCFSMSDRMWYELTQLPCNLGYGSASCTYGLNKLFVSGGSLAKTKTLMYCGNENTWTSAGTMNDSRSDHVMAAVGDSLYVLGGEHSIEQCVVGEDAYMEVGEMEYDYSNSSAAVVGKNILFFGGSYHDWCLTDTKEVRSFDTVTHTLTVICNMPYSTSHCQSIVYEDDTVLTITSDGKILKLTRPEHGIAQCSRIAEVHARDSDDFRNFCIVADDDKQMIILGYSGRDSRSSALVVVKYETGDVTEIVKMPFTITDAMMTRLDIRREHLQKAL
jgi:hypothetical protein